MPSAAYLDAGAGLLSFGISGYPSPMKLRSLLLRCRGGVQ